jgi:hypothetical protein
MAGHFVNAKPSGNLDAAKQLRLRANGLFKKRVVQGARLRVGVDDHNANGNLLQELQES